MTPLAACSPRHVWFDRDLTGGDSWWQEILTQIRRASVFVLVVSTHSLRSRPCLAELDYARRLGVPVLPVQVGDVANLRTTAVADHQVLDYREGTKAAAIALLGSVADRAARRGPLPEPLPPAPAIPYEYLMRLGRSISAPELSPADQEAVVAQLRQGLRNEDDETVQRDLVSLLGRLRGRPDVTWSVVQQIDALAGDGRPAPPRARPAPPTTTTARPGFLGPLLLVLGGFLGLVVGLLVGIALLSVVGTLLAVGGLAWLIVRASRRSTAPPGGH